ncbi:MAG: hypothetical protein AAB613_02235 [Patescibacteria group bacterium]
MPEDRTYEKLLQHDKQFAAIIKNLTQSSETTSRHERKLLRMEIILRDYRYKLDDHDKKFKEVIEKIDNFKLAVMEALDHLVVSADRVDKERLITTYRIDTLDERVNEHDKEIAQLKTKH